MKKRLWIGSLLIAASAKPEETRKIIFNRPFLYGIIDRVSGLPLFLGIMENPTGES